MLLTPFLDPFPLLTPFLTPFLNFGAVLSQPTSIHPVSKVSIHPRGPQAAGFPTNGIFKKAARTGTTRS